MKLPEPPDISRHIRNARAQVDDSGGSASDRALIALADIASEYLDARRDRRERVTFTTADRLLAADAALRLAVGVTKEREAIHGARARMRMHACREAARALGETGEHVGGPRNAMLLLSQIANEAEQHAYPETDR